MEYKIAYAIEILSIVVSVVCLLMFFIGFLGGKLIVVEYLGIIQLCWISLISVKDPVVTFEGLRILRISLGVIKTKPYDFSLELASNIKGL